MGLGFVWLWAFLSLAHSFAPFCSLAFPAALFCYSYCDVIWAKLAGLLWVCCLFQLSITQYDHWVFYYMACRLLASHLFPPRRPWPIYFPWASLILSNYASSWVFTNSFGLPRPNYFILHPWGSWACHQPLTFFTCITSGLLWPILTLLHHILPMGLLLLSF